MCERLDPKTTLMQLLYQTAIFGRADAARRLGAGAPREEVWGA
jgi:hypothetical protein